MKVDYIGGGFKPGEFPETRYPEVAFLGRSNVGKSSLINTLVNRKQMARVSSTPGRTQALHFFEVGDRLTLVDLPGFGYAKAPLSVKKKWTPLVRSYLEESEDLKLGLLLVDVRREPKIEEQDLVQAFQTLEIPIMLVVTKIDKIAKSRVNGRLQQLSAALKLDQSQALGFSALKRLGRDALWRRICAQLRVKNFG